MKIIFLGTPDFAVLPLEKIYESKHEILAVVTQPDKPVGRKAVITPCDVKVKAQSLGLKTLSYNKIRVEGVEELKSLNADIMVTCAYGQILSQEILDMCKYGVINIHASLLPKYRGAAPIQWAIINGEEKTGVTVMQTSIGVDEGDILAVRETEIKKEETAGELFERLSKIGAELIVETLDKIENGTAVYEKQNHALATKVGMLKKQDGLIDFTKTATEIVNLVRGLNPWPIAFTNLDGKMLKIYKAEEVYKNGNAGEIIEVSKDGFTVATGKNAVKILELQLEGSKKMSAKDFLLGKKIAVGTKL